MSLFFGCSRTFSLLTPASTGCDSQKQDHEPRKRVDALRTPVLPQKDNDERRMFSTETCFPMFSTQLSPHLSKDSEDTEEILSTSIVAIGLAAIVGRLQDRPFPQGDHMRCFSIAKLFIGFQQPHHRDHQVLYWMVLVQGV